MVAGRKGGRTYLCEFETDQKREHRATMSKDMLRGFYTGYRFEQYVVSDVRT